MGRLILRSIRSPAFPTMLTSVAFQPPRGPDHHLGRVARLDFSEVSSGISARGRRRVGGPVSTTSQPVFFQSPLPKMHMGGRSDVAEQLDKKEAFTGRGWQATPTLSQT